MSSALTYLEGQQVIHNDIKPGNIAYSPHRGAVLLDFGLANSTADKVSTGGTPWYVPLEFIAKGTRGAPGDVWALGVTMLYVLGKIQLPERSRGWLIRDVLKQEEEARQIMLAWLSIVTSTRETLNRADLVEGLVYWMLEYNSMKRLRAGQIYDAFEGAASSRAQLTG